MDDAVFNALLKEVQNQCHFALYSVKVAEGHIAYIGHVMGGPEPAPGLVIHPPDGVPPLTTQFWAGSQGLLAAAGCLSKIFWPVTGNKNRRGRLRDYLDVPHDPVASPLGSRAVRDAFEHIDERVEKMAAKPRGITVDLSLDMSGGAFPPEAHLMRHFDGGRGVLVFGNDELHVPSVYAEVKRLHALV